MSNVCCHPASDAGDSVVVVRSKDTCARFRLSASVSSEATFPDWTREYFSPHELSNYTIERRLPISPFECTVEGPLNSRSDYETCWRFYSKCNILESVMAVIDLVGWDPATPCQLMSIPVVGATYIVQASFVPKDDGKLIRRIGPQSPLVTDLPERRKPGGLCVVHGVSRSWKPLAGNAWPGLDLHVNACTDAELLTILYNLKKAQVSELFVWGIDFVPAEHLLRLVRLVTRLDKQVALTFVASSLSQVDPRLLDEVGVDNTVMFPKDSKQVSQQTKIDVVAAPDVSFLPSEALTTAETYFVLPLLHPDLVAPFSKVVPHMDSPKVLIYGSAQSGKSTLAQWMIAKVKQAYPNMSVFKVSSSSLFSKYLGSSEKKVMKLFRKAEIAAPSIILIEGIHSLCPSRYAMDDDGETGVGDTYNRMVATFLNCLDGIDTRDRKVAVIATSVLSPEKLDPAAVRPGRLETHIHLARDT